MNLTLEEYLRRDRIARLKRYAVWAVALYLIFFIEPPLLGSRWRLAEINGEPPLVSRMPATVEFRLFLGPWVVGSTGCNYYQGLYFRFSKLLLTLPLSITSMACPEPDELTEQEEAYLAMLRRAIRYDVVSRGRLIVHTRDGDTLTFTRE